MRNIIVILSCFIFWGCKSQSISTLKKNTDNNTLLWRISGNGLSKPSYLFGTFHLLCRGDIHFSNSLRSALNQSDRVYMEIKMDDPNMLSNSMKYLVMKNNQSLKDLVSDSEFNILNNYFSDSLKMPVTVLQNIKPYFLLAMLYPKMLSCSNISGIEEELLKLVKSDDKPLYGLETIEFQAAIFDSIPYKVQAKELMQTIDSIKYSKSEFTEMSDDYKNQRLDKLNQLMLKTEGVTKQYDNILLDDRNKKWVNNLKDIIKNKSVFIAVGAGHLSGPKGLINLFRTEGYTVEPLLN